MPDLKPYVVTIRVFDPDSGRTIAEHPLPVDSPDAEHAAAATLSNAVSFTTKVDGDTVLPVAFRIVGVAERR